MANRAQRRAQKFAALQLSKSAKSAQSSAVVAASEPVVLTAAAGAGSVVTTVFSDEERNEVPRPKTISQAQLNANRANAQLSSGPRSAEGKAKVSMNAVKTSLTSREAFLPSDDAEKYEALQAKYYKQYEPVDIRETTLVQSLVDLLWRLERVNAIEQAMFSAGLKKLREQNPDKVGDSIAGHEFEIFEMYEKQLRNLHLQEARLARRFEKDMKLLAEIQKQREMRETHQFRMAAMLRIVAERNKQPFNPAENGFVFSNERFDAFYAAIPAPQKEILFRQAQM